MRLGARAALTLALLVCVPGAPARAHTLSESFSSWQVNGDTVQVEFTVPDREAKRVSATGKDLPSNEQLARYLADRLGASAGNRPCVRVDGPRALTSITGFARFELGFKCPGTADITLHSAAFYDLVPTHTNFARIQDAAGSVFEQLLTKDNEQIDVSGGSSQSTLQNAGLLEFIEMGIMHIFTGIDHMSFMLGLVLISRRVRDLLFVVTGFTIGHSLTLGLAVTGILRPNGQYIDALVALTIALIGAENIGDSTHRPLPVALGLGGLLIAFAAARVLGFSAVTLPALLLIGGGVFSACYLMMTGNMRDAGRVRVLVTMIFGLIHGFGFASNLLDMELPRNRIAELLFGFNVGVEIGQVTVVLTALLLASLLVRVRLAIPRPLFSDIAAAFLVGEGLFWFVTRSVAFA
jgi:hypothetical protein